MRSRPAWSSALAGRSLMPITRVRAIRRSSRSSTPGRSLSASCPRWTVMGSCVGRWASSRVACSTRSRSGSSSMASVWWLRILGGESRSSVQEQARLPEHRKRLDTAAEQKDLRRRRVTRGFSANLLSSPLAVMPKEWVSPKATEGRIGGPGTSRRRKRR